jgi:hypothetical protein
MPHVYIDINVLVYISKFRAKFTHVKKVKERRFPGVIRAYLHFCFFVEAKYRKFYTQKPLAGKNYTEYTGTNIS